MPSAFDGQLPNGWDDCWGCKQPRRMLRGQLCEKCWWEMKDAEMAADTSHRTGGKSYYRPSVSSKETAS